MTTNETQINDPFAFLSHQMFIVLTTYRKDGTAMPTTVWFAYEPGKVYVTTSSSAGKAKRIRNNSSVQLTPSDRIGNLLGEPVVNGNAREATLAERPHARTLLAQKYGERFEQIAGPDTLKHTTKHTQHKSTFYSPCRNEI